MKLIRRRGKREIPEGKILPQSPNDVAEFEILPQFFTEEELKAHQAIKEREHAIEESSCFLCSKEFTNCMDKFYCNYCGHPYCSDHRLPEKHNCLGNPKPPPFRGQIIGSMGKIRYRYRR